MIQPPKNDATLRRAFLRQCAAAGGQLWGSSDFRENPTYWPSGQTHRLTSCIPHEGIGHAPGAQP
jgi:hypothetical protein